MFSLSWQLHMLGKEYPWVMVFLPTEPSTFPSEFTLGLASRITAAVQIQVHLFHPPGPSLVPCYVGIKSDPLIWHNDHSRAILCHPLPLPLRTQPCLHFQACGAIPAHKQGHLHPSIAPTQAAVLPAPITASSPQRDHPGPSCDLRHLPSYLLAHSRGSNSIRWLDEWNSSKPISLTWLSKNIHRCSYS